MSGDISSPILGWLEGRGVVWAQIVALIVQIFALPYLHQETYTGP